jgi:hypothetical protein
MSLFEAFGNYFNSFSPESLNELFRGDTYSQLGTMLDPTGGGINNPDWVRKNPNRARVEYDRLNEQEKQKVRANNPEANKLFNPTSPAAYRAAGLPSDSSQPLHPDVIGVAITGKEIERGEKQKQQEAQSFYDRYIKQQETQYNQTRTDRQNEFNFFKELTDKEAERNERRYRSPEQLKALGESHLSFRNNLDQSNRDKNLERDKRAATFSSDLQFQDYVRRNQVEDRDTVMKANIIAQQNREAGLLNYSAANLREQMNAFSTASARSNEAVQNILGQGQPNYNWIRRR